MYRGQQIRSAVLDGAACAMAANGYAEGLAKAQIPETRERTVGDDLADLHASIDLLESSLAGLVKSLEPITRSASENSASGNGQRPAICQLSDSIITAQQRIDRMHERVCHAQRGLAI